MAARDPSPSSAQDYTNWSHADLLLRISSLETQLRKLNSTHAQQNPASSSPTPPRSSSSAAIAKKPKKPSKPFDPSRYHTRHVALKFAYLGARYNGFEHHTNNTTPLPTVEEELWRALRKTKLIFPSFKDGQSEDEVSWDGCEYSKCGRTDRGVSAFGQVIGLRVRSSRPRCADAQNGDAQIDEHKPEQTAAEVKDAESGGEENDWHDIRDELPYIQLLNRVLPSDIRVLAWCPQPPADFSARFHCKERRYRYFFTNPAYMPHPRTGKDREGDGWLDIKRMQQAAEKLVGLHDFRNMCKVDPSKQITNFQRRIFSAGIYPVTQQPGAFLAQPPFAAVTSSLGESAVPSSASDVQLYYFEVRGSAFLWHQVRHMVAALFLVGQGLQEASVVDDLLNTQKTPARPLYDMASDIPLVLWDCIFPDQDTVRDINHHFSEDGGHSGYEDALDWIYVGDFGPAESSESKTPMGSSMQDRKYGRLGIMEDLWTVWRKQRIDEVLAGSLMNVVAQQGRSSGIPPKSADAPSKESSARVFDGSEVPRSVGTYVPIMKRARAEAPEVLNARYAVRKGLTGTTVANVAEDADE